MFKPKVAYNPNLDPEDFSEAEKNKCACRPGEFYCGGYVCIKKVKKFGEKTHKRNQVAQCTCPLVFLDKRNETRVG